MTNNLRRQAAADFLAREEQARHRENAQIAIFVIAFVVLLSCWLVGYAIRNGFGNTYLAVLD